MCLDKEAQTALHDLGSSMIRKLSLNESWAMVTSITHQNERDNKLGKSSI